jgi:hypothetical protein
MPVSCAVCSKTLRNPISVQRGTGPVCARHVGEFLALLTQERASRIRESWARNRDREPVGVTEMAIANARARFLARIRRQPHVPVYAGTIDDSYSATRRQNESLSFERFSDAAVTVHSASGREYVITTDRTGQAAVACSCPDHQHRHRVCRHMAGYNVLASQQAEQATRQAEAPQHEVQNRVVVAPTILHAVVDDEAALDRERDRALYAWAERHAHDGVFVSENDETWERLKQQAMQPDGLGEYERENVLDGSNLTFGIELEVEGVSGDDIARALYRSGLSRHTFEQRYSAQADGEWIAKRDGSLVGGCEVVSPVLRDTPETWAAIEEVTRILREHGARTSERTGFHIHISHEVLDDRGYRWQRLGRYMVGFSNQYYRMGAANAVDRFGTPHRGTYYAAPLKRSWVRDIKRTDTALEASKKIIRYVGHNSRYQIINTAKFIEQGVPTVEFRYPNGTVDPVIVQRQIQLAHATIMQAAYLRKHLPGADRLPKVSRSEHSVDPLLFGEEQFRRFLDTMGSDRLRRIATGLWVRGSVPRH